MTNVRFFITSLLLFAFVGPLVPPLMAMVTLAGSKNFFEPLSFIPFSYLVGEAFALIYGAATVVTTMLLVDRFKERNLNRWKLHAISMTAALVTVVGMGLAFSDLIHDIRHAIDNTHPAADTVRLLVAIWGQLARYLLLFGVPNLVCALLISAFLLPGYTGQNDKSQTGGTPKTSPSDVVRTAVDDH